MSTLVTRGARYLSKNSVRRTLTAFALCQSFVEVTMANPKDISRRRPYTVLLVAESDEGARQVERALARMEMYHLIARVQSGQDAIACLKGEGRFANRDYFPFPDIVMLDVTSDVFPVLEWLRNRTPRPVMAAFAIV